MLSLKPILQSNKFLIILFVLVFLWCLLNFFFPKKSFYPPDTTSISGKILSFKTDGNFLSLIVDAKEKVQVFYYFDSLEEKSRVESLLGYGKKISLSGSLEEPSSSSIPHSFVYQKYLSYQQIHFIFSATSLEIYEGGNIFEKTKTIVYQYIMNFKNREYLLALLLGNTSLLDLTPIQNNGISHLFAISGMHISLFATVLHKLLKRFGNKGEAFICIFLLFYAFLVGFTPSVMRSVFLFIFLFLNKHFSLKLSRMRVFLYTFLFLLFLNPFNLMNLGFQYSFLICFTFFFIESGKNYWLNLLKTSTVAFLASIPISAIHFFKVNFLSIFWNLFFVPFVTFIMYPLCFLTVLFPFTENLLSVSILLFEKINSWCQNITLGIIIIPYIYPIFWFIFYLLFLQFLKSKKKKYMIYSLLFLTLVKIYPFLNSNAYVYFLDVGQGDSALFLTPFKKEAVLIDTGGKISYTKEEWEKRKNQVPLGKSIQTFINSLGIAKLDFLVLTHGDYDHMGEAKYLIENLKIERVLFNNGKYNDLEQDLIEILKKKKIPFFQNLNELSLFQTQVLFLNEKLYNNENDNSLVFNIEVYNQKFLFMGDASSVVEEELLSKQKLFKVDFLKCGHHGSKTSTSKSFVERITPSYAVLSVGKNNSYGHPANEVLKNLANSIIYRTDLDGTIEIKIQKHHTFINTYPP